MPIYDEFGSGGTKTNGNIQADVTYKPIISGGTKTNGESHTSAIGSRGTSGGTLLSFQTNWGEAVVFIIRPIIIGAGVEAGNYQGSWGFEWLYIAWPRPRGGTKLDSRSDVWAYYWPPPRNWRGIPYDDTTTARGGIACRKNWPLGVLPIFVESTSAVSVIQSVCPRKYKCINPSIIWCVKPVRMPPKNSVIDKSTLRKNFGPSSRHIYATVAAITICNLRNSS